MDLYLKYIAEREGFDYILEDQGFATFKKVDKDSIYLRDIYVSPEYRKTGLASKIADKVAIIGKEQGCTKMIGSVAIGAKGSTDSLKVLLAYGFNLLSADNEMIYFSKGL